MSTDLSRAQHRYDCMTPPGCGELDDVEAGALHDEHDTLVTEIDEASTDIAALLEEARGLRAALTERLDQIADDLLRISEEREIARARIEEINEELIAGGY